MEGPISLRYLRGMQLNEYDDIFNLTMTYRCVQYSCLEKKLTQSIYQYYELRTTIDTNYSLPVYGKISVG